MSDEAYQRIGRVLVAFLLALPFAIALTVISIVVVAVVDTTWPSFGIPASVAGAWFVYAFGRFIRHPPDFN